MERAPKPWPAGSIATVAIPRWALRSAARKTSNFDRLIPGPKIATGNPPAGLGPEGTIIARPTRSAPRTFGCPRREATAGMVRFASSQDGERKEPKA